MAEHKHEKGELLTPHRYVSSATGANCWEQKNGRCVHVGGLKEN